MPNMTFQCCDCCHEFVMNLQIFQMDYEQTCPECGSSNTKKMKKGYSVDCGSGGVTPCGKINSSGCGGGCGI